MPKLKLVPETGKFLDETGKEVSDLELVNLNEIVNSNVVDKDAVFSEILKDKFNLEPAALSNINDIANKARKEEKDKLYTELETAKTSAKTAEEKNRLLEQQQELLKKQLEELNKGGKKSGAESEEAKALREQLEKLGNEKKEIESNFNDFRTEITQKLEKERLDNHKAQVIAAAGGKIIAELVGGNSIEEINLSAERAKQRYAEIVKLGGGNPEGDPKPQGTAPAASSSAVNTRLIINQGGLKKEFSAAEIASMTPEQYKNYRAEFLQSALGSR